MRMFPHASATALLGAILATPLHADVTADQVWALVRDSVVDAPFSLTSTENRRGDALIITQIRLTFTTGEIIALPDLTLRETPEKSVQIELPPRFPIVVDVPPSLTNPDKFSVTVAAPDLKITVRGLQEQTDFTITAGSLSAALDPVDWPAAADLPAGDLFAALALADLAMNFKLVSDQTQHSVDGTMSLATLHGEMRLNVPDESIQGDMSVTLNAIAADISGFAPPDIEELFARLDQGDDPGLYDLLEILDRGLKLDSGFTIGSLALQGDFPTNPDGPFKLDVSSSKAFGRASLDSSGMGFDIGIGQSLVDIQIRDETMPFSYLQSDTEEFSEGVRIGFPQTGTATPPEWRAYYRLVGMTLSDNIWDMADPGKLFPRDPISVILDFGGTYTVDRKALEPGWVEPRDGGPNPFTAVTIDLNEVMASGLGVSVIGMGSVAYDLLNPAMIEDIPVPEGKLGFVTTGANGVIDRLAQMGVLSSDEITGARFAMLFLGRIEGGADRLVSNIEFRDGSLYLNGQKIR